MGLIKYGYQFKGYNLPTAYARVQVNTETNEAIFYIGANRETVFSQPIEKIKISGVPFTHKVSPFVEAYEFAKGTYKEVQFNEETNKHEIVEIKRPFFDWLNDIVE